LNPYVYANNNPVSLNDPSGGCAVSPYDPTADVEDALVNIAEDQAISYAIDVLNDINISAATRVELLKILAEAFALGLEHSTADSEARKAAKICAKAFKRAYLTPGSFGNDPHSACIECVAALMKAGLVQPPPLMSEGSAAACACEKSAPKGPRR
jgi:hypothetical protein